MIQNAVLMTMGLIWLTSLRGENELFTYLLGGALGLYGLSSCYAAPTDTQLTLGGAQGWAWVASTP